MARKMRKVGEQGPYGSRGRSHATLHRDVAFRHEDHSECPAGCRARCRPHLMIAPADAAAQSVDRGGDAGILRKPAGSLARVGTTKEDKPPRGYAPTGQRQQARQHSSAKRYPTQVLFIAIAVAVSMDLAWPPFVALRPSDAGGRGTGRGRMTER